MRQFAQVSINLRQGLPLGTLAAVEHRQHKLQSARVRIRTAVTKRARKLLKDVFLIGGERCVDRAALQQLERSTVAVCQHVQQCQIQP